VVHLVNPLKKEQHDGKQNSKPPGGDAPGRNFENGNGKPVTPIVILEAMVLCWMAQEVSQNTGPW